MPWWKRLLCWLDMSQSCLEGGVAKASFPGPPCCGFCRAAVPAWPPVALRLLRELPGPWDALHLDLEIIPQLNALVLSHFPQSHAFKFRFVKEPSLFAVAKLLETGLVNMRRIEILWRPLTGHLLEVTNGFYCFY